MKLSKIPKHENSPQEIPPHISNLRALKNNVHIRAIVPWPWAAKYIGSDKLTVFRFNEMRQTELYHNTKDVHYQFAIKVADCFSNNDDQNHLFVQICPVILFLDIFIS